MTRFILLSKKKIVQRVPKNSHLAPLSSRNGGTECVQRFVHLVNTLRLLRAVVLELD